MSVRFKLDCPDCGAMHEVGPSQAGETVDCGCGRVLSVPTLRELRRLETTEAAVGPAASAAEWDPRRGLVFVAGVLLMAAALLTTWRVLPQRRELDTRQPAFREIDIDVQQLTPVQAWEAWQHFREQKLEFRTPPDYLKDRARYREMSRYLYTAWAGAAIGALLIAGTTLMRPRRAI